MYRDPSRRTVLGALLSFASMPTGVSSSVDPIPAAIHRATAADAAYRETGRVSISFVSAALPIPFGWRDYRRGLLEARTAARRDLHALTPETPQAAAALVFYYRARAEASGDPAALRAMRRRLREVFRRPGACGPPVMPAPD